MTPPITEVIKANNRPFFFFSEDKKTYIEFEAKHIDAVIRSVTTKHKQNTFQRVLLQGNSCAPILCVLCRLKFDTGLKENKAFKFDFVYRLLMYKPTPQPFKGPVIVYLTDGVQRPDLNLLETYIQESNKFQVETASVFSDVVAIQQSAGGRDKVTVVNHENHEYSGQEIEAYMRTGWEKTHTNLQNIPLDI